MEEYKGYNLGVNELSFGLVKIKAKGQGKVPKRLSGVFTSKGDAIKAIDGYLNSLKKGTQNEKTKGSSKG